MKICARSFLLSAFFVKVIFGSTVVINSGQTLSFPCYNLDVANLHDNFFLDFYFTSKSGSTKTLIASYEPGTGQIHYKIPEQTPYQIRLSFNSEGQGVLTSIELSDEGMYTCEGHAFGAQDIDFETIVNVNVAPKVELLNQVTPISADIPETVVAECVAKGGKPQATVEWKSIRQFKFTETISVVNSSSNPGLTDVKATLLLEPTRFYNNEVFQCSVTHPAFANEERLDFKANVTYPPVSLQITADKDNTYLSCHADGNPPVQFSWRIPGGAITKGPTVDLISPHDPMHQNDTYVCYAENAIGRTSVNTTAYKATQIVALNEPVNAGVIIGAVIGAIALIVIVLALIYFLYFKRFREEDKGPYMKQRSSLVRQSTDSYSRPIIQHSNDVLNTKRPPSPQHPPPVDDHDRSSDSSSDDDGQDVDLDSRVVQPARYDDPPVEKEIVSRSSINFRANRHRPNPGSRKSRTEMPKQPEEMVPLSDMHYDIPPSGDFHDDQDFRYSQSSGDYRGHPHQQPQYVGYPSAPRTKQYARDSPHSRETPYTEIDHTSFNQGDHARREPYEEPVEYAQILKGHSALV